MQFSDTTVDHITIEKEENGQVVSETKYYEDREARSNLISFSDMITSALFSGGMIQTELLTGSGDTILTNSGQVIMATKQLSL